jgi:hypothetical protein
MGCYYICMYESVEREPVGPYLVITVKTSSLKRPDAETPRWMANASRTWRRVLIIYTECDEENPGK